MAYDVYSQFDLEKHKQTFTNYLEVLIDEDGTIMYAVPSHQEKGIAVACARLNVTRNELEARCPREYYFDFRAWLCMIAKVVFVWNDDCVAVNPTIKQIGALRRLKMAGVYHGIIPGEEKYPDCLQRLSPVEKDVYLHGAWGQEQDKLDFQFSSMASTLKKLYGCSGCVHRNCDFDQDPCESCLEDGYFPEWAWKGENHG